MAENELTIATPLATCQNPSVIKFLDWLARFQYAVTWSKGSFDLRFQFLCDGR